MFKRAWCRLFRRHKPKSLVSAVPMYQAIDPSVTDGWTAMMCYGGWHPGWQSTYWQVIGEAMVPEMYYPDIKPKRTAHITRIIETKTKPLPALDCEAPTLAVPGWQFYAEDTLRMGIDEYATRPMSLAEILG